MLRCRAIQTRPWCQSSHVSAVGRHNCPCSSIDWPFICFHRDGQLHQSMPVQVAESEREVATQFAAEQSIVGLLKCGELFECLMMRLLTGLIVGDALVLQRSKRLMRCLQQVPDFFSSLHLCVLESRSTQALPTYRRSLRGSGERRFETHEALCVVEQLNCCLQPSSD